MLDRLTNNKNQIGAVSTLDHLTIPKTLDSQLNVFLLACQVNGLSEATLTNYQYQLGRFIRFCFEAKLSDAQSITAHHVRAYLLKLQENNSPVSVSDYYKTVKRFFNWLIEEEILEKSPMQNIKLGKLPKLIPQPFSRHDIDNLLLLCSGDRFLQVRNRAMILLFLDTGLRLAEMANIQLSDIDFNRETIKVLGKGAKERRVRMGKVTQKALLRYLLMRTDNYPYLWVTEERRPLTQYGLQIAVKKLCHRAEIVDAKPGAHTFRHTAAINYLRNGGTEFTLQLMLGHSTLQMTRKYVSSLGEDDLLRVHQVASPVDNLGIK